MNDTWKDKSKVKKIEKEMLSPKTGQGVPFQEGCHTWKRRWIR